MNVSNLQVLIRKRSQEYEDNRNTVLREITNEGQWTSTCSSDIERLEELEDSRNAVK